MIKKCFECGETATEEHHIIPKVMGGTKTVPLCTSCHMKVHGLEGTRRADNHQENIKRGIDKNRVWELYAVYIIAFQDEIIEPILIQEILDNDYNHKITINRIETIYRRLLECDTNYLNILFDNNIDSELSHSWNEDDMSKMIELSFKEIFNYIKTSNNIDINKIEELAPKIGKKINSEFLIYKNTKKID